MSDVGSEKLFSPTTPKGKSPLSLPSASFTPFKITGLWVHTSSALILQLLFRFKCQQTLTRSGDYICIHFCLFAESRFLDDPHHRLSPPTYWFIRGDLEPRCHMLPQMGNFPQAIQAPWQQAWATMDAKGKREKELCQAPGQHRLRVCSHVWIRDPFLCLPVRDFAWCALLYVQSPMRWRAPCGPGTPAAPAYSLRPLTRRKETRGGCREVQKGGGGTISLPVTDSSMRCPVPPRGRP